jgi:hypothetical protein
MHGDKLPTQAYGGRTGDAIIGMTRQAAALGRDLILETLAHTHGNRTLAAQLLGISVRSLRNKISEYSAERFHIPRHERRGKSVETIVPTDAHPKDQAAAMPVALAAMSRVVASDCGS